MVVATPLRHRLRMDLPAQLPLRQVPAAPAQAAAPHTATAAAPAQRTANSAPQAAQSTSNANPSGANTAKTQTAQAHRHLERDQHYNTVYGNPWWPNATGWNSGWYGNGYGNGGYYNDPSYGLTSNNNNNAPTQSADVAQQQPAQTPIDNNSPAAAAQAANAVNNSPAVVSLNDAIQQAQNALDSDRQRVIASLKTDADYQKALNARQNAGHELSNTKPAPNEAPAPAVVNAATAKLNAADDVTKMEEQAIANDPKAAADKDRLAALVSQRDAQEAKIRGH